MTEKRDPRYTEWYDIALYFPAHVKLDRLAELIKKLSDHDIDIDYQSISFQDNGMFCDAVTVVSDVEVLLKELGNGDVELDWDTMSEWELGAE